MTGEQGLESRGNGANWTLEEVAEVHAGIFPPDEQARLLAEIGRDPRAGEMLAALQGVVDQLSLIPTPRMPLAVASRLEGSIAAEAARRVVPGQRAAPPTTQGELSSLPAGATRRVAETDPRQPPPAPFAGWRGGASTPTGAPRRLGPPGPSTSPSPLHVPVQASGPDPHGDPVRPPAYHRAVDPLHDQHQARRRVLPRLRHLVAVGIVAALATLVVVGLLTLQGRGTSTASDGTGAATTSAGGAPSGVLADAFTLDPANLSSTYQKISGHRSGVLSNPVRYASCLAANGLRPQQVLGVSDVTYQGRPASALAVAETPTTARVLVVGPDCGAAGTSGSSLLTSSGSTPR